jgi:hypothetical protein
MEVQHANTKQEPERLLLPYMDFRRTAANDAKRKLSEKGKCPAGEFYHTGGDKDYEDTI